MHDLNDLALFAAVVEHGGFAAAERATGTPKSRLSRRVAALETRLGLRLLQRSTRRFAVTPLGEEVARHARAMLAEAEAAEALALEHSSAPRGHVRVACPPALLQHAVGPMLSDFLRAWPRVSLQLQATNRNVDVWQDGVDLALRVRTLPADAAGATRGRARPVVSPGAAEEVVRPLALSPHLLVAAPQLLTNAAPPRQPADLARLPTLGLANSPDEHSWTLYGSGGARVQLPHAPRLVADDMAALHGAVLHGVGCAPLPRLMVHDALQRGELQAVLPDWAPAPGLVQAAYASRRGMRPAVRQLLDALVAGFAQLIRDGKCLQPAA